MFVHRTKAGALATLTALTMGFAVGNSLAQQSKPAKQSRSPRARKGGGTELVPCVVSSRM